VLELELLLMDDDDELLLLLMDVDDELDELLELHSHSTGMAPAVGKLRVSYQS
jgi:hypothetical protein